MHARPRGGALAPLFCLSALLAIAAPGAAPLEPFLAPPEPSGSVEVRLYPTESVPLGTPRLVTFGVPFPRGSISPAGLATVRVLKAGVEIPAHVDLLAPWHHLTDPGIDGASVRIARVQIHHSFAVGHPAYETVTVSWGGAARALDVPALEDPRGGWHAVADGGFLAGDGVSEPDVYAVLPKAHLAKGLLKPTRMDPFTDAIGEGRDSPATLDATAHWPGYTEAERAAKNNFYSLVNEDDPAVTTANRCPFRTDYEPWLYDRASSMFVLHFRSGFGKALRQAVRNAEFYRKHVAASGFFDLKPGDAKYAYNECLAYLRWTTGDDTVLTQIGQVVAAHAGTPHKWSPSVGFWTERHVGFKLLANLVAYEVTGSATYKTTASTVLADLKWHQDGASGAIPAARVDGGLYHYGGQHDGDWADGALGASPWMTALVADAALRAYALDGATSTAHFLRRIGGFAKAAVVSASDPMYDDAPIPSDRSIYAMLLDGSVGAAEYGDEEHSLEVACTLAWARYFAELTAMPDPALGAKAESLYATYDAGVNYWIRPAGPASGLTAFRVSPWRKYGWEHRPSASLSWLMKQVPGGASPNLPPAVAVLSPAAGATFAAGATIPVSAAASDADGTVAKVEFLLDGVEVAEDATAPYGTTLPALPAGPHSITAVATDEDGAAAASAPVAFTVASPNLPPLAGWTSPASGSSFPEGTSISLAASASDSDGSVVKVEFFRDAIKLGEDLTAPWTFSWSDGAPGAHALTARATDDDGASTETAAVTVTILPASNASPTIALTSPTAGSTLVAPATVVLSASASDDDGTITKVEFFSGTALVATLAAPPYSATLTGVPAGSYSFTAKATDDDGASTTTTSAGITVTPSGTGGGDAPPVTAIFRQGRDGYAGSDDVTISTQYLDSTYGNGVTTKTGDLSCFAISGPAGYEKRTLIRFGALGIPAGSKVKSASLKLSVVTWATGFALHGFYVKAPWGAGSPALGWLHRDAGLDWAVPGAGGAGTDRVAGKGFSLSGFKGTGEQTKTVALDPTVVQGWVDDAAADQGVLLVNDSVDKVLRIRSAEYGTKTRRPTLTIVYEPGAAAPAPPPSTVTVAFRTGVGGYTGTRDVAVSTLYADEAWNGGHGATFPTDAMPCYEVTGPGGYEAHAWVRFDALSLPPGAKVKSATLTLAFDTWEAGFTIRGRYVKEAWSPTKITWLQRDLGLPWVVPGGTGEGGDVLAGKSFAFSGFTATGMDVMTVALDPAVVQSWVSTPGVNHGVILVNEHDDKVARIQSSDASTVTHRPMLTITYEP